MEKNKSDHDGLEGLYDFSFSQYERYRGDNPEIAKAIDNFSNSRKKTGDLASLIFPIFYALQSITERFGGRIPCVSEMSAEKARSEIHEIEGNVFGKEVSREFSEAIRSFNFFLDILMKEREASQGARKLFATILRMIQIEQIERDKRSA